MGLFCILAGTVTISCHLSPSPPLKKFEIRVVTTKVTTLVRIRIIRVVLMRVVAWFCYCRGAQERTLVFSLILVIAVLSGYN